MNTRNTEYPLSNRISKRKRQYRNGHFNKTKKSGYIKRKKNILEWVISKEDKKLRILFSTEHYLSNERRRKIKI